LVCFVAALGFAFDIYELLMMPLILRPALFELGGIRPGTDEFNLWFALLLFVPAFVGGAFGLVGGYLTDLLGRRRVLVGSILLYALSALAAGFSTNLWMLLFFRCTTWIGVCVEFVAAVSWIAEIFPEKNVREGALGWTQAFSSLGGLMVTGANWVLAKYLLAAESPILPAILDSVGPDAVWRYTLISGVIPAIPLMVIRPFLPESPAWEEKKSKGTLKRPSFKELFSPELARTTIVTAIMFACSYGAAFGALQQTPRIVPDLPQVKAVAEEIKSKIGDPKKAIPAVKQMEQETVAEVNSYQEFGGLFGRIALAILAVYIVSRRSLLWIFQIPGLIIIPLVFIFPARDNLDLLKIGIFCAGFLTVAQFSFWGNYLPRVYPLHLRGTGEGFAANVGGRIFGTSAAMVTSFLATYMPDRSTALASAIVVFSVYLIGFVASFFLPEPPEELDND